MENLRIRVFGGLVFYEDHRKFRAFLLPREFWKGTACKEAGHLKAKAFILTQSLDHLEALELDEFRVFQVGVRELESRTGLSFAASLRSADIVGESIRREALTQRKPLESLSDIARA